MIAIAHESVVWRSAFDSKTMERGINGGGSSIEVASTWIRREKRYPSGFQGSESVDLGQDLMSRLLDEL